MIRSGLVSITFRSLSPEEIIDLVSRGGLDAIEWGGDVHCPHGNTARAEAVRAATENAGLNVSSYGSYYRAGVSGEEGLSHEAVLDSAEALGAPIVRIWGGNVGTAKADDQTWTKVLDDTRRFTRLAAERSIGVSLEYHANTLTDTTEGALRMIRDVNDENLKLYWQPPNDLDYPRQKQGLQAVLPHVTWLHVFCWRIQEGTIERRPLAEGRDPWMEFFRILISRPMDRYALIEFVRGDEPEQFLRDARALRQWLGELNSEASV